MALPGQQHPVKTCLKTSLFSTIKRFHSSACLWAFVKTSLLWLIFIYFHTWQGVARCLHLILQAAPVACVPLLPVLCIGRQILNRWITREVLFRFLLPLIFRLSCGLGKSTEQDGHRQGERVSFSPDCRSDGKFSRSESLQLYCAWQDERILVTCRLWFSRSRAGSEILNFSPVARGGCSWCSASHSWLNKALVSIMDTQVYFMNPAIFTLGDVMG